ncbi:Oxysterol-binding protein-related protein 6 [Sarcoptes scabiei]|uniref:Oxysterol-binding protein n=1 Tax=Sarcoptes scabiei TaxID=52283 RepID=A0A834VAF6_SARSC|nr:Oxysterol-binding protein-related protein 6 [Sarcoptes scabiei]
MSSTAEIDCKDPIIRNESTWDGNNNDPDDQWQILEGLKEGQRFEQKPEVFCGYAMKRRKWPLKGWHKRYFHLENGLLRYSKTANDMAKNKLHGSADIGLAVISCKNSSKRIDIDSDNCIFHIKVKKDNYKHWVNALKTHRLAKQHEMSYSINPISSVKQSNFPLPDELCDNDPSNYDVEKLNLNNLHLQNIGRMSSETILNATTIGTIDSHFFSAIQEKLIKLGSLLRTIEAGSASSSIVELECYHHKKSRLRFHLRRKKHKELDQQSFGGRSSKSEDSNLIDQSYLSVSHPSLDDGIENEKLPSTYCNGLVAQNYKPITKELAMQDFVQLANEINNNFRQIYKNLQDEQNKTGNDLSDRTNFSQPTLQEKSFEDSITNAGHQSYQRSYSVDSSVLSISEYHDAEDKLTLSDYNSSSSSEGDEDDESITDFSEDIRSTSDPAPLIRRNKLPGVQPSNDISLWSLLYKNIGKDLSKISMPVTINEPLNLLQRLCEELEYCELLEMAASMDDPLQRMLMVAAFAISSYSCAYYRCGHKPFNPLLGETFECVRTDKGFRFISEQVSHHPPISACHAESNNYIFWQDMRVKTKFWGKSMEIIPVGTVNLKLKPYKSHYKWNKVTTCVHNLFKGERYVDIYGELTIRDSEDLTCKITFEKSSYWSSKINEIHGYITNSKDEVIEKIYGKWNESVHNDSRCIWRAGTMPENHELYYGFTRFAIELNELLDSERIELPPTDTRFRPDQRLLEEGNIHKAESVKLELEQRQRDRRKKSDDYKPLWFIQSENEDNFVFNGKYWESRENKFNGINFPPLW